MKSWLTSAVTAPTDADVLLRVASGDVSALGILFDRHAEPVRRVVSRLGVPSAELDDVVQNTFLDVLQAAARYDGRENARPWILGLAAMQVRRHRRALGRLLSRARALAEVPALTSSTPEMSAREAQRMRRVADALDRLSDKKREVIVLVVMEGLSGEAVAEQLGVPVATVWTRLHHARKELMHAVMEEES